MTTFWVVYTVLCSRRMYLTTKIKRELWRQYLNNLISTSDIYNRFNDHLESFLLSDSD